MDTVEVNDKAKQLCNAGVCCSMAEARRVVICGAFDKRMERAQREIKVENQDSTQQTNAVR